MSCPLLPLGFNWVPTTCRLYEVLAEQMQSKKKKKNKTQGIECAVQDQKAVGGNSQNSETHKDHLTNYSRNYLTPGWFPPAKTLWKYSTLLPRVRTLLQRLLLSNLYEHTLMLRTLSVISGNRNWVLRPLVQEMVHVLWWMAINFLAKNKPSGMNVHTPS